MFCPTEIAGKLTILVNIERFRACSAPLSRRPVVGVIREDDYGSGTFRRNGELLHALNILAHVVATDVLRPVLLEPEFLVPNIELAGPREIL